MSVLIVGSIAYDSVESPAGSVDRALGGSATYGGLSCRIIQSLHGSSTTGLVGVVGEDFAPDDRALLASAGLNLEGLEVAAGETFRWEGAYRGAMAEAETRATHLNVFEHFQPVRTGRAEKTNGSVLCQLAPRPSTQCHRSNQTPATDDVGFHEFVDHHRQTVAFGGDGRC